MPRQIFRLNARSAATIQTNGRHADGGGLYLSIASDRRRWVFLYRWNGKRVELGLGSAVHIPLRKAREKAAQIREWLADDIDPRQVRKQSTAPSFGEVADKLFETMKASWRNAKHRAQWQMTLREYAASLRPLPVDKVSTIDVLAVLKPLWDAKPETAARLRGRIEKVLDAATAQGFRTGDNPARWRGHLDHLLPKRQFLSRGHHAAMVYSAVPAFVRELKTRDGIASRALEFLILTAARTTEVLEARWREFDIESATWTVPAERMKASREHRVPLADRALQILREVRDFASGDFVFPGSKLERPMSSMALAMVIRRMNVDDVTVHGFRSSFRDWAAERTNVPREVCEAALAHTLKDKVEAAYRRTDLFEKRRKLMQGWATFITSAGSAEIIALSSIVHSPEPALQRPA